MKPLRILIVDDSTLARKIIKDSLSDFSDVEIVGAVSNGTDALTRAKTLKPDIITLDVEMPDINGLEVLESLQESNFDGKVVMVSNYTKSGAPCTIKALELGAFDFVLKPSLETMDENIASLHKLFQPIIRAIGQKKNLNSLLNNHASTSKSEAKAGEQSTSSEKSPRITNSQQKNKIFSHPDIIAIGSSTGGPQALSQIIPKFSANNISIPIVIVQHMPQKFTKEFAKSLNSKSQLTVKEAEHNEILKGGTVYIAPGGKQMRISKVGINKIIQLTDDPPENSCKPSVDYCLRSISKIYGSKVLCVILTGMGKDGALGAQLLRRNGAKVIVQDEKTSVVFGMPKAVIDAGAADIVCPLPYIIDSIYRNL